MQRNGEVIASNQKLLPTKIKSTDQVLDVGGWHAPLNRANFVIDILPYETRNKNGAISKDIWPDEFFSKKTFLKLDLCEKKAWQFPNKYFDFVFCVHTLEDLRDPIWVCQEILRVG